jgi:hypothetical protein
MKYTTLVVGALASIATVAAHDDPREGHAGIPKMLGARKFWAELRAKNALPEVLKLEKAAPVVTEKRKVDAELELEPRQTGIDPTGQCGPGYGVCPTGQCCSIEG